MNHILPTPQMYRSLRKAYDTFNAHLRDGYNPSWRVPGDPSGHDGDDFYSIKGSDAVATESGWVHWAGRKLSNWGAGKFIELHHPAVELPGDDELSRYLHLSEVLVKKGDWVEQGQVIGKVGCTGQCKSPHVHYGLMRLKSGLKPSLSGLGHIRKGGAVWLDPVLEGILTNTPSEPPPPIVVPVEEIMVIRPTITDFEKPYQEDADVRDAQSALANRGHLPWEGNAEDGVWDGKAGPLTRRGVLSFQEAVEIPQTGHLDKATWQRLLSSP